MMPADSLQKSRLFLLIVVFCGFSAVRAVSMNDLAKTYPPQPETRKPTSSASLWFTLYDEWISPVDGDRCRMSPSCSHYSREAIAKHGLWEGMLMTLDRLQRCGYDLESYLRFYEDGIERFLDPVRGKKEQLQHP